MWLPPSFARRLLRCVRSPRPPPHFLGVCLSLSCPVQLIPAGTCRRLINRLQSDSTRPRPLLLLGVQPASFSAITATHHEIDLLRRPWLPREGKEVGCGKCSVSTTNHVCIDYSIPSYNSRIQLTADRARVSSNTSAQSSLTHSGAFKLSA